MAAVCALAAAALGTGAQSRPVPDINSMRQELIRNFTADQQNVWRYTAREIEVRAKNGATGRRQLFVYYVHGHQVTVTLAQNGHPIDALQLAQLRQAARQRAATLSQRPPPPAGSLIFNHKAYPFAKLAGDFLYGPGRAVEWHGRTVWIYPATPNPRAPSRSREEEILLSSKGEIWVDAEDRHVIRICLATFAPVKYFLGILATVHAAHLDLQLARHAPGQWLPEKTDFGFDATIFFFKRLREGKSQAFSDYQPRAHDPLSAVP